MGRVMLEIQSRCDLLLSFSKHLLMMGVRATGRQSFKQEALGVFCIGTMVDVLKHWGTTDRERERLKDS